MYRIIVNTRKIRKKEEEAAEKKTNCHTHSDLVCGNLRAMRTNRENASRVKQNEK